MRVIDGGSRRWSRSNSIVIGVSLGAEACLSVALAAEVASATFFARTAISVAHETGAISGSRHADDRIEPAASGSRTATAERQPGRSRYCGVTHRLPVEISNFA